MVPKKIHYCWFGRGKKSKLFYKCLKSWKKYFPDYQIIEWNEDNFDVNQNSYIQQAYNLKKYAFVSDYARLKILYEHGGIYFDTDVEVLKKFDKIFLEHGYFAKENDNFIATGLGFAVNQYDKFVKLMLDDYEEANFVDKNGSYDLTPCPKRNTLSLLKAGYIVDDKTLNLDNVLVYGPEYFCGWDFQTHKVRITKNTYTLHHYEASWVSPKDRFFSKIKRLISRIFGDSLYIKIKKILKRDKG